MTMSDPIADMLTRIRNGIRASYDTVDVPSSKLKINVAKILKSEGYIKNFKIRTDGRQGIIKVFLRYDEKGHSIIGGLQRVSKPSRRVYAKSDQIPQVLNGFGTNILSTSKGVMTGGQARHMGIGGEVLCNVW